MPTQSTIDFFNDRPSGSMLSEIEQSSAYLIDMAKCYNLDLKKILNHTANGGTTFFSTASSYSQAVTRRLLEEGVQVNSISHLFMTPSFRVSFEIDLV